MARKSSRTTPEASAAVLGRRRAAAEKAAARDPSLTRVLLREEHTIPHPMAGLSVEVTEIGAGGAAPPILWSAIERLQTAEKSLVDAATRRAMPDEYVRLHRLYRTAANEAGAGQSHRYCEHCGALFAVAKAGTQYCSNTCSAPHRQPVGIKKHGGKSKAEAENNRLMARLQVHMNKHEGCPGPGCSDYDAIQGTIESVNLDPEAAEEIRLQDGNRRTSQRRDQESRKALTRSRSRRR